ncbi:MAG: pre-peptidase C-terminal domain-containing protein [Alphaproteobacteria bacterium]|nr:pre-peptidase C-terminal domain-containing protein [Alphaproteobacteria bacterium]
MIPDFAANMASAIAGFPLAQRPAEGTPPLFELRQGLPAAPSPYTLQGLGAGKSELIAQTFNAANGRYEFSGDRDIDAVLIGARWTVTNLTYSFPTSAGQYVSYPAGADNEAAGFQAFNAAQQAAARYALDLISSYTNLTFTPIAETASQHATIRFAQSTAAGAVPTAQAYFPSSEAKAGDVWFGTSGEPFYATPAVGNWGMATLMHELGHAMGLKHGHSNYTTEAISHIDPPAGGGQRFGSVELTGERDGQAWSLMTYRSDPTNAGEQPSDSGDGEADEFNQPQTYMQQDIAALQYLYGANFNSNAGDTVYTWDPATGRHYVDGVLKAAPSSNKIFMTLWDGNGVDTYDLSNYTTALNIDLAPGAFSTFSTAQLVNHQAKTFGTAIAPGNVANALLYRGDLRSLIENANGGSGNDRIVGNQAANMLSGNGGADELIGGAGNDRLIGGDGADTFYGDARPGSASGVNSNGDGQVVKNAGAGNVIPAYAIPLDGHFALTANADILDSTTAPHVSVVGVGDNNYDWYRVTVAAGTTLRFDIDGTTNGLDPLLELYDQNGTKVAWSNDSLVTAGGGGSTEVYDSLLTYTVPAAGTYYLGIAFFGGMQFGAPTSFPMFSGQAYRINVSAYGAPELGSGAAGNDTLDGGAGNDTMTGGAGNDTYVYAAGDVIVEAANAGTDTIQSAATLSLAGFANIENLTLTGSGGLGGTGNALNNLITGNTGANGLNGGGGADTLRGGDGNDTLTGGGDADSLAGGSGNDTYVNVTGDTIVETAGGGVDTVQSDATVSALAAEVERLFLTGTAAINGTGNELANTINGNTANNVLAGLSGNDTISGAAGGDTLQGGAGADRLTGGTQRDKLVPGVDGEQDILVFNILNDSTGVTRDVIDRIDLNGEDRIDLPGTVAAVRAQIDGGNLSTATFNADLTAAVTAAKLGAGQAVLFDPSGGNQNVANTVYLIVDANGVAGYQANQDWVFQLENMTGTLDPGDFI